MKMLSEQGFCIMASDVKSLSAPFCHTPSGDNCESCSYRNARGWARIADACTAGSVFPGPKFKPVCPIHLFSVS